MYPALSVTTVLGAGRDTAGSAGSRALALLRTPSSWTHDLLLMELLQPMEQEQPPPVPWPLAAIVIPDASPNGFSPIPIPPATIAFQPTFCGGVFGLESETTSQSWTCKSQHQIITELITLL